MGDVHRVHDDALDRVIARKTLRPDHAHADAEVRFLAEARATAGLEHPGIVPVYDLGRMEDGRPYFTMKEVRGHTFGSLVAQLHRASDDTVWRPGADGWTLHRLADALRRAAEALAYAHARGVLHGDVTPANLMLGAYGEVLLLDWGLARAVGSGPTGDVSGTPAYMAPEVASGARPTTAADVYGLGAVLYELLHGAPPADASVSQQTFRGSSFDVDVIPEGPLQARVPADLARACDRARARHPGDRLDAAAFAGELQAWLDGSRRREEALALVSRADDRVPAIDALRRRALDQREAAARALSGIPTHEPADRKREGWAAQDEADALDREARLQQVAWVHLLEGALLQVPDLPEARERLADHWQRLHARAEEAGDAGAAAEAELYVRRYDDGRREAWLKGDGALSLRTDPDGAEATLYRYELHDRRRVPVFARALGRTPLAEIPLPMGSWLVELAAPGHARVRYPVHIGRQQAWTGIRPGESVPTAIRLPREGELAADDVYIPAGWFVCGGDPDALLGLPRSRVWLDAYVMARFPVTNGEYVAFLNDRVAAGREDEALRWVPRERSGGDGDGAMIYGRVGGQFVLRPDTDGVPWRPDEPVSSIDRPSAEAYAAWLSARTGQPWRLPGDQEWEKAARGVDGRFFPWGDFLDPSWCCMMESHTAEYGTSLLASFPVDESPYSVRHLSGNVRGWCLDAFDTARAESTGPENIWWVYRGGSFGGDRRRSRSASRDRAVASYRSTFLGFRLARSI